MADRFLRQNSIDISPNGDNVQEGFTSVDSETNVIYSDLNLLNVDHNNVVTTITGINGSINLLDNRITALDTNKAPSNYGVGGTLTQKPSIDLNTIADCIDFYASGVPTNAPVASGGYVSSSILGTNNILQVFTTVAGTARYFRVKDAGTWKPWVQLVMPSQLPIAPGNAPMYTCRAWVNFNGTGTVAIRGSGNVSSITDNGIGDYTVSFTTAMNDTNYSTIANCDSQGFIYTTGCNINATTTTSVRIGVFDINSKQDRAIINVAVFG